MALTKKRKEALSKVDATKLYDLEEASQKLKKVGYYKYWEADYYKETVEHRHNLQRRINMRGMKIFNESSIRRKEVFGILQVLFLI